MAEEKPKTKGAKKSTTTAFKKKATPQKGASSSRAETAPKKGTSRAPKTDEYRPNLLQRYHETVVPALKGRLQYKNSLQVPKLEKISLNIGIGKAKEEPASLEHALDDLATIAGQKGVVTRAKKAISNFKLRVNDPVGCRVTLRRWRMYEFLERLISVALPRVRDFSGFSVKSFDGRGNFSVGIEEQIVFPEIDYDKIDKIRGLEVTIVTTARTDREGHELLSALGFPFREPSPYAEPAGELQEV